MTRIDQEIRRDRLACEQETVNSASKGEDDHTHVALSNVRIAEEDQVGGGKREGDKAGEARLVRRSFETSGEVGRAGKAEGSALRHSVERTVPT